MFDLFDKLIKSYFLVINSERAAMYAPDFKGKMIRTNKTLLEDFTKTFITKAKEKHLLPDIITVIAIFIYIYFYLFFRNKSLLLLVIIISSLCKNFSIVFIF